MRGVLTSPFLGWLLVGICCGICTAGEAGGNGAKAGAEAGARTVQGASGDEIAWGSDYAVAMESARRRATMMVVAFGDSASDAWKPFASVVEEDPLVRRKLRHAVCVRLPVDASIQSGGKPVVLLEHPAFAGLSGRPGIAILDFVISQAERKGQVVRTVAMAQGRVLRRGDFDALPDPGPVSTRVPAAEIAGQEDYEQARQAAQRQGKMLLIYFRRGDGGGGCREFEEQTLADTEVRAALGSYVVVRVPDDGKVSIDGRPRVLLEEGAFAEMAGLPGIAVVDYGDPASDHYGQVVSAFPFLKGRAYGVFEMLQILNLPPGTLTQRTLIYAVRTHPDHPASTDGVLDANLTHEAESHSRYQASIRLQGHHRWETRFHRINRKLPRGLLACEVCAESWPGENLLEAAIDCVHSWRLSSGHWSAVRSREPFFGYDMKRGSNGIWYATGIFGRRHSP